MFGCKVLKLVNRLLIFLVCVAAFVACASPMEKSVIEPLTSKELDKVAGKDVSFLATYSIVEGMSNHIYTPEDSSRWKDITYTRLHNYIKTIESAELNSPLFAQLREKWGKMYDSYSMQADSIISHWKNYLQVNSPDSLLHVSYEGIEIERFKKSSNVIDTLVKAKVTLTPLRYAIDSLFVLYAFHHSDETPSYIVMTEVPADIISHKRKLREPSSIKVFPNLPPHVKSGLISNDSSFVFSCKIDKVYMQGKCFNEDSLKMELPKSVLSYIEAENTDVLVNPLFDQEFYKEKVIKELVNPSFVSKSAYIKINAEHYYKQIDSLVFNYLNYNGLQ